MVGRVMAPSNAQNAVRAVSAAETAAVWMEWYTAAESDSACLLHSVWSSPPVVASVHCVTSQVAECLVHEICLYTQDTQIIVTSLTVCGGSPWRYSVGLGRLSCSMISTVCTQMAIHLHVCKQPQHKTSYLVQLSLAIPLGFLCCWPVGVGEWVCRV